MFSETLSESNTINCRANVITRFEWIMKDFPCIYKVENCSSCIYKHQPTSRYAVTMSKTTFHLYGLNDLQTIVDRFFEEKQTRCPDCKEDTLHISYKINSYLIIDVEFLHEKRIKLFAGRIILK